MPTLLAYMAEQGVDERLLGQPPATTPQPKVRRDFLDEDGLPPMPTVPLRSRPLPPERLEREAAEEQNRRVFTEQAWFTPEGYAHWLTDELAYQDRRAEMDIVQHESLIGIGWTPNVDDPPVGCRGSRVGSCQPTSAGIEDVPMPGQFGESLSDRLRGSAAITVEARVAFEAMCKEPRRLWEEDDLLAALGGGDVDALHRALAVLHRAGVVARQRRSYQKGTGRVGDPDAWVVRRHALGPVDIASVW